LLRGTSGPTLAEGFLGVNDHRESGTAIRRDAGG
jgi:hypothetical protein